MRTFYCHPVDPLRKFDPTLSMSDLESDDYINSSDDVDKVLSAIEEAESEWDTLTRNPQREVRVGTPGHPATYETQDVQINNSRRGMKIWLDNREIVPIDPSKDVIEIRSGRGHWNDITSHEGDNWDINYEKGYIKIYRRLLRQVPSNTDDFLRISYRHNALGGNIHRAGQTTLSSDVAAGDMSLNVDDAGRLPPRGILFIGGDEYISATVDHANDTISVGSRGVRGTSDESHSEGDIVHYCTLAVRKAVAAKAAIELLVYDDWVGQLVEGDQGIQGQFKVDEWQSEWETEVAKHAEVRTP